MPLQFKFYIKYDCINCNNIKIMSYIIQITFFKYCVYKYLFKYSTYREIILCNVNYLLLFIYIKLIFDRANILYFVILLIIIIINNIDIN